MSSAPSEVRVNTHADDACDCGGPSTTARKHASGPWRSLKPSQKLPGRKQVNEMRTWYEGNQLTLPSDETLLPEKYRQSATDRTLPFPVSTEWTEMADSQQSFTVPIQSSSTKEGTKGTKVYRHFTSSNTDLRMRVTSENGKVVEHEWLFPSGGSISLKQPLCWSGMSYIKVETSKAHLGLQSGWKADSEIKDAIPTMLDNLQQDMPAAD